MIPGWESHTEPPSPGAVHVRAAPRSRQLTYVLRASIPEHLAAAR